MMMMIVVVVVVGEGNHRLGLLHRFPRTHKTPTRTQKERDDDDDGSS